MRGNISVKADLKRLLTFFIIIFLLLLSSGCSSSNVSSKDLSYKLLRFHVIANSDSLDDQSLKLKVRDKVLNEVGPKIENSKSKQETVSVIRNNIDTIKKIAEDEISREGKNYSVDVSLGKSTFPAKSYSDIVLPAGVYDALKITIGQGQGKNWWCVMFPPLCFIDISHNITSEETENRMKTVLNNDEYDSILRSTPEKSTSAVEKPLNGESAAAQKSSNTDSDVKLKFKSLEIIKSIIEKFKSIF